jgi:acyl-CoA thioester hydrolase
MGRPLTHRLRVRYAECDLQGVVFNSHYLVYFDTSLAAMWREAFDGYRGVLEQGLDVVVAEAQLRFRAPARFDEELTLEMSLTRLGETSITSAHRISRGGDLIVEGMLRHVLVDLSTLTKTPIPDWMRKGLGRWTASEGD